MQLNGFTKLSSPSRRSVYIAFMLICAFAMYSWIMAPHVAYLRAVYRYQPTRETLVDERTALYRSLTARQGVLDELTSEFNEIRKQLFDDEEARTLFNELQTMATVHQCSATNIDIMGGVPVVVDEIGTKGFVIEAIEANMSIVGSYNAIIAFVRNIQSLDKKVWIDWFHIKTREAREDQLQCSMTITVYIIQERQASDG